MQYIPKRNFGLPRDDVKHKQSLLSIHGVAKIDAFEIEITLMPYRSVSQYSTCPQSPLKYLLYNKITFFGCKQY